VAGRVIRGKESWFGQKKHEFPDKLTLADKRIKVMEFLINRRLVIRKPEVIEKKKDEIISFYKPEKLGEELINIILYSEPSFWLANDLFYRAVILAFKEIRPRL